jgi:hypothetical protein
MLAPTEMALDPAVIAILTLAAENSTAFCILIPPQNARVLAPSRLNTHESPNTTGFAPKALVVKDELNEYNGCCVDARSSELTLTPLAPLKDKA